jgi:hypothetical protein
MSLNAGAIKLKTSLKKLYLRWDESESHWNDAARRDFEQEVLSPLQDQVLSTLQGIGVLAEIIDKAERDCS